MIRALPIVTGALLSATVVILGWTHLHFDASVARNVTTLAFIVCFPLAMILPIFRGLETTISRGALIEQTLDLSRGTQSLLIASLIFAILGGAHWITFWLQNPVSDQPDTFLQLPRDCRLSSSYTPSCEVLKQRLAFVWSSLATLIAAFSHYLACLLNGSARKSGH